MNRLVGLTIIATACAWSFAIARICWFAGDYMIGFSLFIMLALPFAAVVLTGGLFFASVQKSKLIAACSVVGCAFIVATLFNMHRITQSAWRNSLAIHSEANQTALRDADFSTAQFTDADFPDDAKMMRIDGFEWYCDQHLAAPNGEFRGFVCNSIKHIYVNKIRHGLRGVAWIPESTLVSSQSNYEYRHSGVDNWYIWTYGG